MSQREWECKRKPANDESREHADHNGERWVQHEEEIVMLCASEDDIHDAAELLGRTIEAVRLRLHIVRTRGITNVTVVTTSTTTTTTTVEFAVPLCGECNLYHRGEC